jgi:hypothetical protein
VWTGLAEEFLRSRSVPLHSERLAVTEIINVAGKGSAVEAVARKREAVGGRWRALTDRLRTTLRRHLVVSVLLGAGVVIRVAFAVAYWPALLNPDSKTYLWSATTHLPAADRPFGYPALLMLLAPAGPATAALVSILQHLAGLVLAVVMYRFLDRRGVARTTAALAVAPTLLDAWQVSLEQLVMSEVLFSCLLCAAFLLLLRTKQVPPSQGAPIGALLSAAALTRTVGLPLIVPVLGYLLLSRSSRRALAATAVMFVLPLAGYATWYHHERGVFAFGQNTGRFLYGQAAHIVDCASPRLHLTAPEHGLCPSEPLGHRPAPQAYTWGFDARKAASTYGLPAFDPLFLDFSLRVFAAQPGDLARAIAHETLYYFEPAASNTIRGCMADISLPTDGVHPGGSSTCRATLATGRLFDTGIDLHQVRSSVLSRLLHRYGALLRCPGPLLGVLLAPVIVALLWIKRTRRRREMREAMFLTAAVAMLLVVPIATVDYDSRYAVPALPLLGLAAALAVHALKAAGPAAAGPAVPGADRSPEDEWGRVLGAVESMMQRRRHPPSRRARSINASAAPTYVSGSVSRSRTDAGTPASSGSARSSSLV